MADAAKLGYNFLNVGGEEPLRYPWLAALCREAHKHGMLTSMITRSASLTAPQLEWLRFSIDLLGVEIEGKGTRRNRRASAMRAPQTTEQRLTVVRDSGIPFAIVFSLTSANLGGTGMGGGFRRGTGRRDAAGAAVGGPHRRTDGDGVDDDGMPERSAIAGSW